VPQADSKPLSELQMLTLEELEKLPAELDRKSAFRKNSQYVEGGAIPTPDSFYFWANGQYLYYSESKELPVILGAIKLS